jgi:hypothetical protein
MSHQEPVARDDLPTVIAVAALAICTTAVAHEAFGHGSVCLALGGHITLLTNAYFRCSAYSSLIDIGGPVGNLIIGLIALVASRLIAPSRPLLRFYAVCVAGFSLYWEAGYAIFSMLHGRGDYFGAWTGLIGPADWPVRIGVMVVGAVAYVVITKVLALSLSGFASRPGRIPRLLRPAWITSVVVMGASASLYAPDRLAAMHDAALSAAAAIPFLFRYGGLAASGNVVSAIRRCVPALVAGATVVAAFALLMGRGLS